MATRKSSQISQGTAETKFLRGDTGVDGQATEEARDASEVEAEKAKAGALSNGAYLGREFLTWLLWRSESGEPLVEVEGEPVSVLFSTRLIARAMVGQVTEVSAKGVLAPYSPVVRQVLASGLLVQQARLQLTVGERVFQFTIDAENLDVRSAKLPELLAEEESERVEERLYLTELLSTCIDVLARAFLQVRNNVAWSRREVPALSAWLRGEAAGEEGALLRTAARASRGR